ncbi:MAG: M48 family metalloprotease [Desulfobaccales bacterium]
MNRLRSCIWKTGLICFLAACLVLAQTRASLALFDEFKTVTIEREKQLGEQFLLEFQQEATLIQDPFLTSYVNHIGQKLVAQMGPQPFKYKFFIVKDPTMNAFAVPGGYVFLNTGMILMADKEEELAGVMAHEVSHIYCRHMAQMMDKARIVSVASILGTLASVFLGGAMAQPLIMGAMGGGQAGMLAYSREFEGQADAMGFRWMLASGYNPEGMVAMFKKMNKQRWYEGGTVPLYLRTHPYTNDRIVVLENKVEIHRKELPPYGNYPDFQYFLLKLNSIVGNPHQLLRGTTQDAIREPQNPVPAFGRALALAKLDRASEAEAAFQQALKLDPKNFLIKRELALFYFDQNRYPEAYQLLEELSHQAPQDEVILYYLGRICEERKQLDQAISLYEKAYRLNPTYAQVYYNLGTLYGEKGQLGPAHYYLGMYSLRAQALPTALFHFKLALKNLSPGDGLYADAKEQMTRLGEMKVGGGGGGISNWGQQNLSPVGMQ